MKATLALVVAVFVSLIATRIAAAGDADRLWRVFLCIHRHEGDWDANTGNGYYGGLQMDRGFQLAYGREFYLAFGTADHWTPAMQITVAIRAYLAGRGFTPWPNTRGMCGL